MKQNLPIKILIFFLMFILLSSVQVKANNSNYETIFEEICSTVEKNFYDESLVNTRFMPFKNNYRNRIVKVRSLEQFSELINEFLANLKTSHTSYITPTDQSFYHLGAVFWSIPIIKDFFKDKQVMYPSIGMFTESIDNKIFVSCILAGSPANKAGLLRGDEIISVNEQPFKEIISFKVNVNKQVKLKIRRHKEKEPVCLTPIPQLVSPIDEMLVAQNNSIRIIEKGNIKIGYIQIYSYAGKDYHQSLKDAISWGKLKDADALLIDLRYGLGGANPSYLDIFNQNIPKIERTSRSDKKYYFDTQWRKPAAYLVNGKTRSGKEILAFGAKKYKLATVIGETTAGAVTGGALFPISNGTFLYLAIEKSLIDGINLEGVGVEPDIMINEDIRYSAGKDSQIEQSIKYLLEKVKQTRK